MSYEIENDEPIQFQCRHVFTDGRRCASPTLRSPGGHEPFCYYHHTTRGAAAKTSQPPRDSSNNRRSSFALPLPEDRSSIQHSIGEVLRRIAANEIDSRRAGLLLYGLQIASLNLKNDHKAGDRRRKNDLSDEDATVTEITHDPHHGLLAPPAELHANQPLSSAQRFLMELGDVDEPTAEHAPLPQTAPDVLIDLQACAVVPNVSIPGQAAQRSAETDRRNEARRCRKRTPKNQPSELRAKGPTIYQARQPKHLSAEGATYNSATGPCRKTPWRRITISTAKSCPNKILHKKK